MKSFAENREFVEYEYERAHWIEESGLDAAALAAALNEYVLNELKDEPMPIKRAKAFTFLLEHAQIEINPHTPFSDKLNIGIDYSGNAAGRDLFDINFFQRIRHEVLSANMPEDYAKRNLATAIGLCYADSDYWHTLPDWENVIKLGIPGLLRRAEEKKAEWAEKGELSGDKCLFYDSVILSYKAILMYMKRLYDASLSYDVPEFTACVKNLMEREPRDLYEVMELCFIFLNMEEIGVERARSFGRIDQLYLPYFRRDLESGRFTLEEIKELIRYFYIRCQAAKRFADQPFAICGVDENGRDATNELTRLLLDVYDGMGIHNPKIHVCCHPGMPRELLRKLLSMIRGGSGSICLISNEAIIKAYEKIGISRQESQTYTPFGCYEPILVGLEEPMIGASWLNMSKAVEFALNGGRDVRTGKEFSENTPLHFDSYEEFKNAFFTHLTYIIEFTKDNIEKQNRFHMQVNPSPIYSGTLTSCMDRGRDVFNGGMKYHNISIKCCGIATVVDSLLMVKKFVFDDHVIGFDELRKCLENNWKGYETLHQKILRCPLRYGNHNAEADALTREVYKFAAGLIVNKPTPEGGRYRMGCDSITNNIWLGGSMAATPDGRMAGEPFSKNFNAVNGMDRGGVTAYMLSVLSMDATDFVDGAVMDFVLHPSAVEGEAGLDAFEQLITTYFRMGGCSIQGNIMNLEMLKEAREHPEKYRTLQVRVCGWNEYFVEMSREVQDMFIHQLEGVS